MAFMMLDADGVAVSPSNVYRVLSDIDMPADGRHPARRALQARRPPQGDPGGDRLLQGPRRGPDRGLDAGANCYLTKSSFHDQTFLDTVVDLIGEVES